MFCFWHPQLENGHLIPLEISQSIKFVEQINTKGEVKDYKLIYPFKTETFKLQKQQVYIHLASFIDRV